MFFNFLLENGSMLTLLIQVWGLLQGVGYLVPGDTWRRRGGWSAVPTRDGKGVGAVLGGRKSPVLPFCAVAIQQCVLVDKYIFA